MPRAGQREKPSLVVVGAGAAGSVIAARVTERSDRDVLLLEAGPDYARDADIPADLRNGRRNSMRDHDWGYRHWPTAGQGDFAMPRGRVVGGSSAVNTCIALRGNPDDYDDWAAMGLPEWAWEHCLPAFKRLENDLDFQNEWHGNSGPIPIRRHPRSELTTWQAAFLDACGELRWPTCDDHNDPTKTGAGAHAMNKINGERMNAARCYLTESVRARDNLSIRSSTHVRRVLLRKENGRTSVIGVEVERDGVAETIATSKVVLSSGAIATPGVLLRSGIGPRDVLDRIGVPVVVDLPAVGARLLDHPGTAIFVVPRRFDLAKATDPIVQTTMRYRSSVALHDNDMQLQPGSFVPFPGIDVPIVSLMCSVGKPRGTGRITYRTNDPHEKPLLQSQLLHHDEDRKKAVEAMELAYECSRTYAMRGLFDYFWPSEKTLRDRVRIDGWIRRSLDSGYHPSGTVPMGRERSGEAAVDGRGRVFGVEGLVVADASIFPTIPMSNTHLPTLMVGERFGEWLREE